MLKKVLLYNGYKKVLYRAYVKLMKKLIYFSLHKMFL